MESQTARSRETGQSIVRALLIGLLGHFLVLSFQFRSYLEPIIVMLSIQVAFMGAVWRHLLMGYNLYITSNNDETYNCKRITGSLFAVPGGVNYLHGGGTCHAETH